MPVDFDSLTEAGSMMGSGGMIVMDDQTCMVDVARYFIAFLTEESCGKCVPCREGLRTSLDALSRITEGKGKPEDVELLHEIGDVMQDCCLCALGTSAPNPVLSTLRYFKEEYDAHIKNHVCPAGVCKDLIEFRIDRGKVRRLPRLRERLLRRTPSRARSRRSTPSTRTSASSAAPASRRASVTRS